jgi:hypothetical protein
MATPSVRDTRILAPQTEALVNGFVRRIATLTQVRQVRLEGDGQAWRLWTLIQAEPFDRSAREPVYQAQFSSLQEHPAANVTFRLVNLAEYPEVAVDELEPTDARLLWPRPDLA